MLQRKVLRDDVYEAMLDLLLSGQVSYDDSLSIDRLAKQFGVSQTPVREAMVELERTGLVTRTALRGYRVAPPITQDQIRQLIDARIVLEGAAVERSFAFRKQITEELHTCLLAHQDISDALVNAPKPLTVRQYRQYFDADWSFHQIFLDNCNNQYLSEFTNNLSFSIHRMRQSLGTHSTDAQQAVSDHQAIYDAFVNGTKDEAVAAMIEHLNGVLERSLSDWLKQA